MFIEKELYHDLKLDPQYFGPDLKERVLDIFHQHVSGRCDEKDGYVVAVLRVIAIEPGRTIEGEGLAVFRVKYRAIVLHPFPQQVVSAVVTDVSPQGFFSRIGPVTIFTPRTYIPDYFSYNGDISPPQYQYEQENLHIRKDTCVRIRLISVTFENQHLVCNGTINDHYLAI
ncbi:hypothetical protein H696_04407 [Fonticula alba]|uniref:RNA polymerase Rpb7-like N-terminal domain-containing protein n=1 Tax=Fonticula alba TaxID=691883 RepID=A0A058Z669_FONAL|nr:hypothetical protein H696_04407 [Fonticula alba]KCV68987.1 hypothetical protein H696_04407 [Fonticula alba]|eukprot:XP_009496558.1 hypothetical protein H696_04407 [Fonticula alba]